MVLQDEVQSDLCSDVAETYGGGFLLVVPGLEGERGPGKKMESQSESGGKEQEAGHLSGLAGSLREG